MTEANHEALSYVWDQKDSDQERDADSDLRWTVTCNVLRSKVPEEFEVTKNLHSALRQLRYEDRERRLWIDQICINQKDKDEKAIQIGMMTRIYEESQIVLVWLGVADDTSDRAMEYLPKLVDSLLNEQQPTKLGSKPDDDISVHTFLRRPWFERVWTLQEAAKARECLVLCGSRIFDFKVLQQLHRGCQADNNRPWRQALERIAVACPFKSLNDERSITAHILAIVKLKELADIAAVDSSSTSTAGSFLLLFNRIRSCKATDPRDRIYCIYGLLPQAIREAIGKPNYDLTVEDLYQQLAATQVVELGNLAYLGGAGIHRRNLSVPSWVPDYTHPEVHYSLTVLNEDCLNRTGSRLFQAAGTVRPSARLSKNSRQVLEIKGKILGKVQELGQPFHFPTCPDENAQAWLYPRLQEIKRQTDSYEILATRCEPYPTGASAATAFKHTIMCSMEVQGGGPAFGGAFVRASDQHIDEYFDAYERSPALMKRLTQGPIVESQSVAGKLQISVDNLSLHHAKENLQQWAKYQERADAAIRAIGAACSGRAFFVTGNNYMGLAPSISRPGDEVCILFGCPVPFIIRPLEVRKLWMDTGEMVEQKHYVLVGESYAYGLMDGEALEDTRMKEEVIYLR